MVKNQQGGVWGGQGKDGCGPYQAVNQSRVAKNGGGVVGFRQSAWPTLQQSQQQLPGSGMRAVFLGNPAGGAKRECSGTGVFIPRRTGTPSESRKKPGVYIQFSCSGSTANMHSQLDFLFNIQENSVFYAVYLALIVENERVFCSVASVRVVFFWFCSHGLWCN